MARVRHENDRRLQRLLVCMGGGHYHGKSTSQGPAQLPQGKTPHAGTVGLPDMFDCRLLCSSAGCFVGQLYPMGPFMQVG